MDILSNLNMSYVSFCSSNGTQCRQMVKQDSKLASNRLMINCEIYWPNDIKEQFT